jgi:hypothetical protein
MSFNLSSCLVEAEKSVVGWVHNICLHRDLLDLIRFRSVRISAHREAKRFLL